MIRPRSTLLRRFHPAVGILALAILAPSALAAEEADAPQAKTAPPVSSVLTPAPSLAAAIDRGVAYLLRTQKKEGYWGSPRRNMGIDIYGPTPGSQRAFQVGATALALSGLIEAKRMDPRVAAAIERGAAWLQKHYAVRRIRPNTLYNTWAIFYSLETFARLLAHEKRAEQRKTLLQAARGCVKLLRRYEFVEGGWGYYNFSVKSWDPGQGSTSFSTASALVALGMARAGRRLCRPQVRPARRRLRVLLPHHLVAFGRDQQDQGKPGAYAGLFEVACHMEPGGGSGALHPGAR